MSDFPVESLGIQVTRGHPMSFRLILNWGSAANLGELLKEYKHIRTDLDTINNDQTWHKHKSNHLVHSVVYGLT